MHESCFAIVEIATASRKRSQMEKDMVWLCRKRNHVWTKRNWRVSLADNNCVLYSLINQNVLTLHLFYDFSKIFGNLERTNQQFIVLVASKDFHVLFLRTWYFISLLLSDLFEGWIGYLPKRGKMLFVVVTFRIFILIGRKVYCVIKHIRK